MGEVKIKSNKHGSEKKILYSLSLEIKYVKKCNFLFWESEKNSMVPALWNKERK